MRTISFVCMVWLCLGRIDVDCFLQSPINVNLLHVPRQQRLLTWIHIPSFHTALRVSTQSSQNDSGISPDIEEEHLLQMIQHYKESKMTTNPPSKHLFTDLIDKWLSIQQPDRAESILDKMEEIYTPSGRVFERIINNWSYISIECANRAKLMSGIEDEEKTKVRKDLFETSVSAANHALDLLLRMEQLCEEVGDDFRPALSTYTSAINALNRSSTDGNTDNDRIKRLLEKRDELYKTDTKILEIKSDHDVFSALKHLKNGENIMSKLTKDKNSSPYVNSRNFNIIINELAKTGETWAALVAEDILDHMIDRSIKNYRLKPKISTFNACMNAWANVGDNASASRAEAILEKLNTLQTSKGLLTDVIPDNVSYNTIIKANAKAGNAAQAEATLNTMERINQSTGDQHIKPDSVSYSSVLHAYAQASPKDSSACIKAENVLMNMLKEQKMIVTTIHFNTVLNAHATLGSGKRAAMLLKLMEDMTAQNSRIRPDLFTYNTVLKALAKSKEKGSIERAKEIIATMEKSDHIKPNTVSYNTLILAHVNHGAQGGVANTVRGILNKMEMLYLKGVNSVMPTSTTYTSVIKGEFGNIYIEDKLLVNLYIVLLILYNLKACAWEREDSVDHAERVLESLTKKSKKDKRFISPDTPIYNALLDCWAKSGSKEASKRAEEILQTMLTRYQETGDLSVKPNVRTYTTIIDILAKGKTKGNTEKAMMILDEMERLCESGDTDSCPNVQTYTAAINCFARSKESDKAIKAVSILERMEEQYRRGNIAARPNIVAYNAVLNACAYTEGDSASIETAFKLACVVFDDIRTSDYLIPTHVTYGTFLAVCANLMPESEITDSLVEATFKRCARDGMVSKMVWKNASPRILDKFGEEKSEASWSRNV